MDRQTEKLIEQIDALLERFGPVEENWHDGRRRGFPEEPEEYTHLITTVFSLINKIYTDNHIHTARAKAALITISKVHLLILKGILQGARDDLENGFLDDLRSNVILDIKTDFIDSAKELIDEGQKDPAAVLACIVLEDSLKRLAALKGIEEAKGKEMNAVTGLLRKHRIITQPQVDTITSFQTLRNAALHADWEDVSKKTVCKLLEFLPSFIDEYQI